MKKLLLILLCIPMIYSCRQYDENGNRVFINDPTSVTYDFESNFLDVDSIRHVYLNCEYYDKLCEDIKDEVGVSLYNTGEKEVEVTCSESIIEVTFYYKNGNKKSSNILKRGCGSCGVEGTTWWENGNLQRNGNTYWYENGQIKYEIGVPMSDGRCKATSYYENGQTKKEIICEYGAAERKEVIERYYGKIKKDINIINKINNSIDDINEILKKRDDLIVQSHLGKILENLETLEELKQNFCFEMPWWNIDYCNVTEKEFFDNKKYNIGDTYLGGIIFYLDGDGGGLIAAPLDQSTSANWGTAVDICANLTLGGYSDWYLPSEDEIELMYANIGSIPSYGLYAPDAFGLGNIGGFTKNNYWSSTDYGEFTYVTCCFINGTFTSYTNKNEYCNVRAVRAF